MAAEKNSPFGSAIRKVFNPVSVSENLLRNATVFYSWLDGKSTKLLLVYKIGGTTADQAGLVSSYMKLRYDQLPACTTQERKALVKVDALTVLETPCSVGAISTATFDMAAKKLLSEPEAKEVLKNGIKSDSSVTSKNREEVLVIKKMLGSGIIIAWIFINVLSLLMVLLFTPAGVNFIATGLIVGMTGLSVGAFGRGLGSVAVVLKDTLGNHIALQGVYIAIFGLLLVCVGIWQIFHKKAPVETEKKTEIIRKVEEKIAKKDEKE